MIEIAWRRRFDYHSRIRAIRVAFDAAYAQAVPNAQREEYYKSKLPSVLEWARRKEATRDVPIAEEPEVEEAAEMPVTPLKPPATLAGGDGGLLPMEEPVKPPPKRKRARSELKDESAVMILDDAGNPPVALAPTPSPTAPNLQPTKRARSIRATTTASSSLPTKPPSLNSKLKMSKLPAKKHNNKPGKSTKNSKPYLSLPHMPFEIKVIFDRYPALYRRRQPVQKHRQRQSSLDITRLIFVCKKANASSKDGRTSEIKLLKENSFIGPEWGGGAVFLRRNARRVRKVWGG